MEAVTDPSAGSVGTWLGVRRTLAANRLALSAAAAGLYPDVRRVGSTTLLCREDWIPAEPVGLDDVVLRWRDDAPAPAVDGTGPLSRHVRPAAPGGERRYASYSAAIGGLDRPALFEDRACYRLLAAGRDAGTPVLEFADTRYFTGVNLSHAVAHELAAAWRAGPQALTLERLPLRAAVGDPCALARRPALCAVIALTLRRSPGGEASFVLHWRDPARVNHAGGMYQVMPAGIFQPLDGGAAARRGDFSLWRSMVREFSEEFLGTPEEYATGDGPLDYDGWPFQRRLAAARREGGLTVWHLGAGVDPLTLATDLLTVAVFDADVFDEVFAGMVAVNAEGRVVTGFGAPGEGATPGGRAAAGEAAAAGATPARSAMPAAAGIPFTAATVAWLTGGGEPVQPAGAGLLQLAWRHRERLLA